MEHTPCAGKGDDYEGILVLDEDAIMMEELAKSTVPTEKQATPVVKPITAKGPPTQKKGVRKKIVLVTIIASQEKRPVVDKTGEVKVPERERGVQRLVKGQWRTSYDCEGQYLREISRYNLLTPEEERELLQRYASTKDEDAWNLLVACNQRLVVKHAKKYSRLYHMPFLDMVQEGNIGLMHAIKRFSPDKECRLATYAVWWIKQLIERAIMNTNRTIRLPVYMHGVLSKARKATYRLLGRLDREPTQEEVCKEAGISVKSLRDAEEGSRQILSMDYCSGDPDNDRELGDCIPDERPLQDELMYGRELSELVIAPALAILKPQQLFVIVMRFGLTGVVFTERDIAKAMKIGKGRVLELEVSALQKLGPPDHVLFDRQATTDWLRRVSRSALTLQEDTVCILRYGIGLEEGDTLESIGQRIGVCRERVRQVEIRALFLLRRSMDHGILKKEKGLGIYEVSNRTATSAAVAGKGVS